MSVPLGRVGTLRIASVHSCSWPRRHWRSHHRPEHSRQRRPGDAMRLAAAARSVRCCAVCCSAAPVLAATRTDLDQDWQFRVDPDGFGETLDGTPRCHPIPRRSTCRHMEHRPVARLLGVAWYFRRIEIPPHASNTHFELHFGATFYKAHVWLNGVDLGGHEGGFTAYSFDVTPLLRDTNVLAVRIDNRPDSTTIPGYGARGAARAGLWWTYGGVVRDVWLTSSGPAWMPPGHPHHEQRPGRAGARSHLSAWCGWRRHAGAAACHCVRSRQPHCGGIHAAAAAGRRAERRRGVDQADPTRTLGHRSPEYVSHGRRVAGSGW